MQDRQGRETVEDEEETLDEEEIQELKTKKRMESHKPLPIRTSVQLEVNTRLNRDFGNLI